MPDSGDELRQVSFRRQAADIRAIGPELEVQLAVNWRASWPENRFWREMGRRPS